ncbi:MAG: hypothetical protein WAM08_10830, partial [Candidatus Acidiferrales bacterium]
VRDVRMLVKYCHYVAKIADVHGYGIEFGVGTARYGTEIGDRFGIRRMICGDSGDAAREEIAHDALADEAEATSN